MSEIKYAKRSLKIEELFPDKKYMLILRGDDEGLSSSPLGIREIIKTIRQNPGLEVLIKEMKF